ncbi:hypothetical protein LIER_04864 [Lithospermum erythrorhizon]|uniref:Uncharacterized protein n=1 Tax=Lithospermum erythrorhizon TaxID=34254 RepID=A0AAV3NZV8_LITER
MLPSEHTPGATPPGASGHSTTVVLEPEDHREVGSTIPEVPPSTSLPALEPHTTRLSSSLSGGRTAPKKRMGSLLFLGLQGVVLLSFKGILSTYEEASGSSSRACQLENELKTLRKKKAREEGALQHRLRNLTGEHNTLQEKYVVSVRRAEAVKAELEGMQAERDCALLKMDAFKKEMDALKKERESLRAGSDEMLQTNDRLLGRNLLLQHFTFALERTIQVVQTKLDEADLEVPKSFWDSVRDDVSPPNPSNL